MLTDVSPYGRMRDPVALGINSSPPPLGVSPSLNRHAITQSFDHIGLSRSFEHPASPRAWAPQTVTLISFPITCTITFYYYAAQNWLNVDFDTRW